MSTRFDHDGLDRWKPSVCVGLWIHRTQNCAGPSFRENAQGTQTLIRRPWRYLGSGNLPMSNRRLVGPFSGWALFWARTQPVAASIDALEELVRHGP